MTENVQLAAGKYFAVTDTGITFDDSTPFYDWMKKGEELHLIIKLFDKNVRWWLGDWILFGEHKFADRYTQALESSMYSIGTIRNCVYVCRNVPPHVRNKNLQFEHHYAVAKLDEPEQIKWLELAEKNAWTLSEMRKHMRGINTEDKLLPDRVQPFEEDAFKRWYEENEKSIEGKPTKEACQEAWKAALRSK